MHAYLAYLYDQLYTVTATHRLNRGMNIGDLGLGNDRVGGFEWEGGGSSVRCGSLGFILVLVLLLVSLKT